MSPVVETAAARDDDHEPAGRPGAPARLEEKVDGRLLQHVVDVLRGNPESELRDLSRGRQHRSQHIFVRFPDRRDGDRRFLGQSVSIIRPALPAIRYAPPVGAEVLFENVTKIYGGPPGTKALDGIELRISGGEFAAVVGPSGCGKSTLLHLAGGIDVASSGRVRVSGRDLGLLTDEELTLFRRRGVGTVFQFFNLIPALTVRENVELPLALDGSPEAPARARELLGRVGLADRESSYPYELSGGQLQRVAVARALSARPALLLADEPTGNLDSAAGGAVLDLIDALRRDEGVTVLLATHSAEAAGRADRVVRLRDGRIV